MAEPGAGLVAEAGAVDFLNVLKKGVAIVSQNNKILGGCCSVGASILAEPGEGPEAEAGKGQQKLELEEKQKNEQEQEQYNRMSSTRSRSKSKSLRKRSMQQSISCYGVAMRAG